MNILITGSSGLVGTHLITYLVNKGYRVVGYDRNKSEQEMRNYTFEQGELEDFPRIASIIKKYNIELIVHGGGISHPIVGGQSPNQVVQTNIIGTTNIFEAARLFDVKRVIFLSSGAVYGDTQISPLLHEGEKLNPTSIYGVTKVTGEYLGKVFSEKYGIDVISLRLPFVYGPGRVMPDPIKYLLEKAKLEENIKEEKGRDQKLEYIYVKDVVRAIELALNSIKCKPGDIINIGSGELSSMEQIISVVLKLYPDIDIKMGSGSLGYDEMGAFDCTKAKEKLNFTPEYSIKSGIIDYSESI